MKILLMTGDRVLNNHVIFLLQKFIIHLVIGSAETNFKYPYDSSDLQDG
jgi:hypothetical protein